MAANRQHNDDRARARGDRAGGRAARPARRRGRRRARTAALRRARGRGRRAGTPATRQGDELPPDAPVAELALRHGDEIRLRRRRARRASRRRPSSSSSAALDSGRRIPLASGTHRIGRSAEVALDDPALSGEHLVLTIAEDGSAHRRRRRLAQRDARRGRVARRAGRNASSGRGGRPGGPNAARGDGAGPEDRRTTARARRSTSRFNRPPRVQRPLEEAARPFPAPPTEPQRSRLPLGASLIPLALGVALYLWTKLPDDAALLAPLAGDGGVHLRRGPPQRTQGVRAGAPELSRAARLAGRRARSRAARGGCSPPRGVPGGRRADPARPPARAESLGAPPRRPGLPRAPGRQRRAARRSSASGSSPAAAKSCAARSRSSPPGTRACRPCR